jgi:hypothetical protein
MRLTLSSRWGTAGRRRARGHDPAIIRRCAALGCSITYPTAEWRRWKCGVSCIWVDASSSRQMAPTQSHACTTSTPRRRANSATRRHEFRASVGTSRWTIWRWSRAFSICRAARARRWARISSCRARTSLLRDRHDRGYFRTAHGITGIELSCCRLWATASRRSSNVKDLSAYRSL